MADDWQIGDYALCIELAADDVFDIYAETPQAPGPVVGLTYTVKAVLRAHDCYGRPGIALAFVEIRQRHPRAVGYNAACFQKAQPHTADAEDAETIALLTGTPAAEPVS